MNKLLFISIVIISITSLLYGEIIEAIVARVNDEIITLSEVKKIESDIYKTLSMTYESEELEQKFEQLKKKIINNLIEEKLLLQKAKEKGINVEQEVNDSIERLKQENNIRTDEELSEALTQEGLTIEDIKKQLRERTMQQKLLYYYLQGKISITEQELLKYYDEHKQEFVVPASYRISNIFISFNDKTKEEAYKKTKAILEMIKNGEDFTKLATEYSENASKEKGGDLGFLMRNELNEDLAKVIDSIPIDGLSEIIESSEGYHIFKLVEKVESRQTPYEEVKENVYQKIFNERAAKYQDEYMDKLKKENYIEIIYDPYNSDRK